MNVKTLDNLPNVVRENKLKNLAENIVKYQKFKTNAIISKIGTCGYTKSSIYNYINFGIQYINNNRKERQGGSLYKYIDEAISKHIQPLTPKENERRLRQNFVEPPIVKVLETINKKKTAFVVKFNNNALMYEGKDEAEAFKQGLYFAGISANIVEIKYEEVL